MSGFNNQEIHYFSFVYMFGFSNQEIQIFGIFIPRTIQAFFCSQSIHVFGFRNRDSVIKILVDLCLDLEIETQ